MKNQIIIALLAGLVIGAGITWGVFKASSDSIQSRDTISAPDQHSVEENSLFDLESSNVNLVAFDEASQDSVIKWVQEFREFNSNLSALGMPLEPSLFAKGDVIEYNRDSIDCGLDYWYVSKDDFNYMFKTDEVKGFKIYPAIRKLNVRNSSPSGGRNFDHDGFTLIFTPTDGCGKNLIDADSVIRAFEYVDPCPKICKDDAYDIIKLGKLPQSECN